ncbi:ABC transporter ATP-binding protein [Halothermothrix orenii]|uniref:ABC transporter related n=1 Tax=Halothermothrix orenii (strain H 168 / OCM 544 / DSM 9562) TaxID=373903 RepID=B8CWG5_HALOH|nr:ABC transporter ATP-binding protein [Halothermothrix orenii]ACL69634.1 ABC transporter related [Halothermothrix orenii H 168]
MNNGDPVIQMNGITKRFPGVVANDKVDFELKKGEIHALLGENGAGKTTLMKCLYGLYQPDEGDIFINGKKVSISDPNDAINLGIGMVHQHFMLVPPFTVAENIVLGSEPVRNYQLDYEKAVKDVKQLSKRYKLNVDPEAKVQDISVGMQQRVEILKALYRGADILILDEPTAVLTPQEVDELIDIMRSLTEEGKSIIFITHKLKEVKAIADRVTVIRRGKLINTVEADSATSEDLAKMMVGREVLLRVEKEKANPGEVILEVSNIKARNDRGLMALNGTSFSVRRGEILGIAGVEGNGQSELAEVLTGLREIEDGEIYLKGKNIASYSTRQIIEAGVSYIPEDRQKRGLVLDFALYENLILGNHYRAPYSNGLNMNYNKIRKEVRNLIKDFDIRTPDEDVKAKSLSGGNQQKVIIAREFNREHDLLIAAQPTRGVDVGAIEFIHKQIIEQRDSGKAVLLISLELDEILSLSDRIAVIYEGEIVDILDPDEATEEKLGMLMAGATTNNAVEGGV